ncbi:MAG: hypothetical protein IKP37_15255 [Paludibacteraceae bacterium]|nr:hypothetical protein [Paludibacteraceae bacterium]
MSLTVSNPKSIGVSTWFPSNGDLTYSMSSTNSTVNGFYYLIEVYVNNNKAVTLRKYPIQGVTTTLNVRDIVNAYITSNFTANVSPSYINFHTSAVHDWAEFHIIVTEWYNGEDWDSVTTIPMYAWDAAIQFEDMIVPSNQAYSRYFTYDETYQSSSNPLYYHGIPMGWKNYIEVMPDEIVTDQNAKPCFLLDVFKSQAYHMARGDKRQISIFSGYSLARNTEVGCLIAYGFDADGTYIKKAVKNVSPTNDTPNYHWLNYNFTGGTESNWNYTIKIDGTTFTDMSDCKWIYYCFAKTYNQSRWIENAGSYGILVEVCDYPESYTVLYKSYEGGWRHILLNRRSTETTDVKTITRQNVAPNFYGINTRLVTPVNVSAQSKLQFHTDWITEPLADEVKDMLISPCLYIQHYNNGTTNFIPVTLQDAEYTTKEINDVNLFNFTFDFIESFEKNTILQ